MDAEANVRVVLEVFAAIEQRGRPVPGAHRSRGQYLLAPSLPWNDGVSGRPDPHGQHPKSWLEVWAPLQPTAAERQMHPEVIAAANDRVVARWHQRGRSPTGLCIDAQVLGLYQVREGRLVRAQMFYFDTDAVNRFLGDAADQGPPSRPAGPPPPGR